VQRRPEAGFGVLELCSRIALGLAHYYKKRSILLNPAKPRALTRILLKSTWGFRSNLVFLSTKGTRHMDELIKRITEKTGISEDQARSAVNTVSGFLKEKLPAPLAGQVDNVLSGAGGMTDKLGDAASKVGGIFGGS
jgi:hypothetical protein